MKWSRLWGLRGQITVTIAVLMVFSVVVVGGIVYSQSRKLIVDSLGTQALAAAERAIKIIDPVQYKDLIENGDENHTYYLELRESLNNLRENAGLLYLYTMDKEGSNYTYRVDAMPVDSAADDVCPFGMVEDPENISEEMDRALAGEEVKGDLMSTDTWGQLLSVYMPIKARNGEILGFVGADLPAGEVFGFLRHSFMTIVMVLAVLLVLGVGVGYLVARGISRPLEQLAARSEQIRDGDLSLVIEPVERDDEIGRLYLVFSEMVVNLRSLVQAVHNRHGQLLKGVKVVDESTCSTEHSMNCIVDSINDVARGSERQVEDLGKAVSRVNDVSKHIVSIEETSQSVQDLSSDAEKRAASGREVLLTTEKQVGAIDDQARNSAEIIRSLGAKIVEVTQFVSVISSIARQTNLLALNAAIESARAGEEGQGFAVVAKRIKGLAEESAEAAEKVSATIAEIQQQSEVAVQAIEETVEEVQSGIGAIKKVDENFTGVLQASKLVRQQVTGMVEAIRAIAGAFKQLENGMNSVSAVSEEANASAEEVAALVTQEQDNIEKIKDESKSLVQLAEEMQREIQRFKI